MMFSLFTKNVGGISTIRQLTNSRFFSQTMAIRNKSSLETPSTPQEKSPAATDANPWKTKTTGTTLTAFDKRVLVWSGKYKSVDDVPSQVARETLDRARDRFRVKGCLGMMAVCLALCIVQIIRGKKAAERGESVVKSNLEWHRQYNEETAKNDAVTKSK